MSKVNFSINRLLHFAHNITSRKCKVVAIYYSFFKESYIFGNRYFFCIQYGKYELDIVFTIFLANNKAHFHLLVNPLFFRSLWLLKAPHQAHIFLCYSSHT